MVRRDLEIVPVDRLLQLAVAVEHQRGASMLAQARLAGGRLDDGAVRRQVAAQDRERALRIDGLIARSDHVVIAAGGAGQVVAQAAAVDGQAIERQLVRQPGQHGAQAAGIIEVLHQILAARRPDVGEHRDLAADPVEIVQAELVAGTARLGDQMHDRVGRTAQRHDRTDRVLEGRPGLDLADREILPDHLDDSAAGLRRHPGVVGIGRRNRGSAGQGQAQGFGRRGHGAGRAHGHAMAMAAGNATFDLVPVGLGDPTGPQLVPVLPAI